MGHCPMCGGTARSILAPGFYRCESVNTLGVVRHLGLQQPVQAACGHEYQEAASAANALCQICGTFAVGICQDCHQLVCGIHSKLISDKRICVECIQNRTAAMEAHRQAAEASRDRRAVEFNDLLARETDVHVLLQAFNEYEGGDYPTVEVVRNAWQRIAVSTAIEPDYEIASIELVGKMFTASWRVTDREPAWRVPDLPVGWKNLADFYLTRRFLFEARCSTTDTTRSERRMKPGKIHTTTSVASDGYPRLKSD